MKVEILLQTLFSQGYLQVVGAKKETYRKVIEKNLVEKIKKGSL